MNYASLLFPPALHLLAGLLVTCTSLAEEAKTSFANGVKVEVAISRPSKTAGGDFDDKTQIIKSRIKMMNTTNDQDYTEYKAVYIVIGESAINRKIIKVLLREEFPISITARNFFERETENVETMYDTSNAKFGHKYDGWIIQITDPKGEIVYTKSTSSALEKMPKEIQEMKANFCYDKKLKQASEPSLILNR